MPEVLQHGRPYQEPERHDELSSGVPESIVPVGAGGQNRERGRFALGCSGIAAKEGSTHKGRTKLSHVIEGNDLTEVSRRRARVLRKSLTTEIASTVGGGYCGVAASLFVKFAAQKTAAAEEAFERGDYPPQAQRERSDGSPLRARARGEGGGGSTEARRRPAGPLEGAGNVSEPAVMIGLRALDRALVASGWPGLSTWWEATFGEFELGKL
jgi:hypothetical protein